MRANTNLTTCSLKDPLLDTPGTAPTHFTSTAFKSGAGQMFRVRSELTVSSTVAAVSSNIDIHPFWITPSSQYILTWAHIAIVAPLTVTGAVTDLGFQLCIDSPSASPVLLLIQTAPAGNISAGTYSISNSNRIRMSMASDPGPFLTGAAPGGTGNTDYLWAPGNIPGSGTAFYGYGASTLSKDIYLRVIGDVGSWSLTGGVFRVEFAGFITS